MYQASIEVVVLIDKITEKFPRGRAYSTDQLQRAGTPISLNMRSAGILAIRSMRALIELDKRIMSLYMLDYIDDEGMHKTVPRSLIHGESYHQLRWAIAKISSRKLAGKTEIELARLLANCMIFYNASLLSGTL